MDEQKCIQLFVTEDAYGFKPKNTDCFISGMYLGCFTYKKGLILCSKINTALCKAANKVYNLTFVAYDDSRAATAKGKRRQAGTA